MFYLLLLAYKNNFNFHLVISNTIMAVTTTPSSISVVKQKHTLNIDNHDFGFKNSGIHGPLFPDTIRCLIVGPSNCGKTNVMISLIEHENGLKFENIYIYLLKITIPTQVRLFRKIIKTYQRTRQLCIQQ